MKKLSIIGITTLLTVCLAFFGCSGASSSGTQSTSQKATTYAAYGEKRRMFLPPWICSPTKRK